ncbi:DNA-binding IclR family transcriptional regulator [Azospirillum lipoferum]|uniref:Helix-turn-helix domain-containing protein n=1 Tax=Azospirillum lipoferum TaxID=193 RepID=A0A5A9GM58_AZOLI|nr:MULTISPECIES: helix-turn-helix domain-containing protein [Azospirillum]KAA0594862.1 helix-turn-helix domain-containing protein [Azospirillum lipoferum]MCP1612809.1 DNA-binding IclR family transcriptional regulator [Azospirillum lipoferum]MDW5532052.1 helix-turn-helix domain-containing protein [Azospirillum sp. NL1]
MDAGGKPRKASARLDGQAQNRSLERGLEILKAFRPGADVLGNSELAEKTGIAKATVSRLTQTLVTAGLLVHDPRARAYRLGATVLSLALAVRLGNPVLQAALPLMRSASDRLRVNVGLATADHDEMVYLDSVRYNRKSALRTVVSGQRVPIELTSLGRAYLAAVSEDQRVAFLRRLQTRRPAKFAVLEQQIVEAIDCVKQNRYCAAAWQLEVVALSTPLVISGLPVYVVNMSLSTPEPLPKVVERLHAPLLSLRSSILDAMDQSLAETSPPL